MRIFLCVALAFAVGCSAVPASNTSAPVADGFVSNLQGWIPGIFADAWETVDANVGMDYKFGAHAQVTDWAAVGVFDYADISVLGLGAGIFTGDASWKSLGFADESLDCSMTIGAGVGASATLHTWQVLDLWSSVYLGWTGWTFAND